MLGSDLLLGKCLAEVVFGVAAQVRHEKFHRIPTYMPIGICPDGQLSSVKSARYVLASTEELHHRIQTLTFRIHELEHALETTYDQLLESQIVPDTGPSRVPSLAPVHPMLEPHLKKIAKDPREQDADEEDDFAHSPARVNPMSSEFDGVGDSSATFDIGLEVSLRPERINTLG